MPAAEFLLRRAFCMTGKVNASRLMMCFIFMVCVILDMMTVETRPTYFLP